MWQDLLLRLSRSDTVTFITTMDTITSREIDGKEVKMTIREAWAFDDAQKAAANADTEQRELTPA